MFTVSPETIQQASPGWLIDLATGTGYAAPVKATLTITDRVAAAPEGQEAVPPDQWPAKVRTVIGTPRQLRPNGDWFFPVEREWYDSKGGVSWAASGLVLNPFNPSGTVDPLNTLLLTHHIKLDSGPAEGQTWFSIVDAAPGSFIGHSPDAGGTIPAWPDPNWARIADQQSAPLKLVTEFGYSEWGLLQDIYYPNGRRWARRVQLIDSGVASDEAGWDGDFGWLPPKVAREYIFKELVKDTQGNWFAHLPGEVKIYQKPQPFGQMLTSFRAEFEGPIVFSEPFNGADYTKVAGARIAVDSAGRLVAAESLEWTGIGWSTVGTKMVNDLGEMYRELETNGNITRWTRNSLGHRLRRYTGTIDADWLIDPVNPDPNVPPVLWEHNMALVERIEYGETFRDAWLPTITRRYTSNPSWYLEYHEKPQAPDNDGIRTKTSYDWRMRPVKVETFPRGDDSNDPPESTTLTYLDHLGRTRMIVMFGAGAVNLGNHDPMNAGPSTPIPAAHAFLASGVGARPVSITEMIYGPDGSMTERRSYDVAGPAAGPLAYHAEFTYQGSGGRTVFAQRPGSPVELTVVDGAGRVASSIGVLPGAGSSAYGYQLTRTDFRYDRDGNVIESIRWERVKDDDDVLGLSNAVRTRTVNWYDLSKRLIATADLGTERADGFVAGAAAYTGYDAQNPPKIAADGTILRGTLPPEAILEITEYERKSGHVVRKALPNGTITTMEYSPAGRLVRTTENAYGTDPLARRVTEYTYSVGRVATITASRTEAANSRGTTTVQYTPLGTAGSGGDGWRLDPALLNVVDDSFTLVSANRELPWRVYMPDPQSGGGPSALTVPDYVLRYTFSGQIAERIDPRGVAMRYSYDDAGRLSRVVVGHYPTPTGHGAEFEPGYPPSMTPSIGAPVDRVGEVEYRYDAAGRLSEVIARTGAGASVIAHNRFAYDARGNLISEEQSHGVEITANAPPLGGFPKTSYGWQYQPTNVAVPQTIGHNRLTSVTYPNHRVDTRAARIVEFAYGSSGSGNAPPVAHVLNWPTQLTTRFSAPGSPAPASIAAFTYSGGGRRIGTVLGGDAITQTVASANAQVVGYPGLDRFGRLSDLNYVRTVGGQSASLFRAQYTYDRAGNRLTAQLTQRTANDQPRVNVDSQHNQYDGLDRLIGTRIGALSTPQGGPQGVAPNDTIRHDVWRLDRLGNWTGRAPSPGVGALPGRWSTHDLDAAGTRSERYVADNRNRVLFREYDNGTPAERQVYDRAGNLVYDRGTSYRYDAWGRLVQVNRATLILGAGRNTPPGPEEEPLVTDDGVLPAGSSIDTHELLKHYTYDGLGRLIRTQSPWPDADSQELGRLRSERFYYDGARRIQELVIDPVVALGDPEEPEVITGDPEPVDGSTVPLAGEAEQVEEGEVGGNVNPTPGLQLGVVLAREYIWGPGDGHAGVDECLVFFDGWQPPSVGRVTPWWTLQDGGGDLAALAVRPPGSYARVAAQFRYDAYGAVLSAEVLGSGSSLAVPHATLGHKGLFVDRLDVGVTVPGGPPGSGAPPEELTTPRLALHAELLYQVRNRVHSPRLGRFLQRDPNATGQTLASASAHSGRTLAALSPAFSTDELYGDGANLYAYLGSNPWTRSDPSGLFFLDLLLGSGQFSDLYADYAEQAEALGSEMMNTIETWHVTALAAQEEMAYLADDWSVSDEAFNGLNAAGESVGPVFYEEDTGGAGGSMAMFQQMGAASSEKFEDHHIIPQFLHGTDHDDNMVTLTQEEHRKFHAILRGRMSHYGLRGPSARGDNKWTQRIIDGEISTEERIKIRRAIDEACELFDGETQNRYKLHQRLQNAIKAKRFRYSKGNVFDN